MAEGFDFRLVSHDNLCTHCVYSWPEYAGFSCSVLRGMVRRKPKGVAVAS